MIRDSFHRVLRQGRNRQARIHAQIGGNDGAISYIQTWIAKRLLICADNAMLGRIYDKVLDHGGYDMVFFLPAKWLPAEDGVRPEVLRHKNMELVFAASVFSAMVSIATQLFFLRKQVGRGWLKPNCQAFKQSMSYSMRFYFGRIANPMQIRPEMIVIPIVFANVASLGLYAQGIAILDRILLVAAIVGYVLTPRVAGGSRESAVFTACICRIVFFATLILGIVLMSFAKYLVPMVFGAEFSASVPLMWLMLPGLIFRSVARIIYHYFQGGVRGMQKPAL